MTRALHMEYRNRPSTAVFMLRALYPTALRRGLPFPPLRASWTGHRVDPRLLGALLRLTGMGGEHGLVLYPHVFGFPLQMSILTHPAFPLPILARPPRSAATSSSTAPSRQEPHSTWRRAS